MPLISSICAWGLSTSRRLVGRAMVVLIVSLGFPAAASADIVVADRDAFSGAGG